MMVWIAATVAVFYALGLLALALFYAAHLQIPDERPRADVALVLPLTGPSPSLEELLAA
jgi:hypothetical protein